MIEWQQQNVSWEDLQLPDQIIDNLVNDPLRYTRPSKIQNLAITKIKESPTDNFIFQSPNGSGKTGAFSIPAIMKIDPTNENIQVIIMANTRELMR